MLSVTEQIRLGACTEGGPSIADLTERVFREVLPAPGFELREAQIQMARQVADTLNRVGAPSAPGGRPVYVAEAPCGCHAAGQAILMADATTKAVEDVVVGDILQGPDGPRTVLNLHRGEQQMFDVVPKKGNPWRVNLDHVLTLLVPRGRDKCRTTADLVVVDVTVREYLGWSASRQRASLLFRVPVSRFHGCTDDLIVPPYVLGALLGDGYLPETAANSDRVRGSSPPFGFTSADPECWTEVQRWVEKIGMRWVEAEDRGGCKQFRIVGDQGHGKSIIRPIFRELGLAGCRSSDKFIPIQYKRASVAARLEILAGLMDTDGSLGRGQTGFDFISKSRQLAEDVAFVARSVGLAAYVQQTMKQAQTGHVGVYFRVSISGNTERVPTRIARKQSLARKINKDPLRVGFEVRPVGASESFFGFSVDGDQRYLLGDFMVTHNSGKGLAYLVPSVLTVIRARHLLGKAHARVVISTSNIALQRQLVRSDIPMLEARLANRITAAVVKSRGNYVCPDRLDLARMNRSHPDIAFFDRVDNWLVRGGSGDREDIPMRLGAEWGEVSVESGGCIGHRCPALGRCPSHKARVNAQIASLLITNHAFIAASPASFFGGSIGLVVDEAHDMEDALRRNQGSDLHDGTGRRWKRKLDDVGLFHHGDKASEAVRVLVHNAMHHLGQQGEVRLRPGWVPATDKAHVEKLLDEVLEAVRDKATSASDDVAKARLEAMTSQFGALCKRALDFMDPPATSCVWVDRSRGRSPRLELHSAPVDVALCRLSPQLPIVLTSATIGSPLGLGKDLGLVPNATDSLPHPWPIAQMGVVVVPAGAPDANSPGWQSWATGKVVEFVRLCGGGVLVLSTSWSVMRSYYEALNREGFMVRCQGDAGRSELTSWFEQNRDSVLVATRSYFQGVDIPGDSLRGVVLDKIPFPSPSLLESAINEHLVAQRRDPFRERTLAKAKTAAKQAAGRLLRASTDRGAVLVLDGRLLTANYGTQIQRALQPLPLSTDMADVTRVLGGKAPEQARHVPAGRRAIRV